MIFYNSIIFYDNSVLHIFTITICKMDANEISLKISSVHWLHNLRRTAFSSRSQWPRGLRRRSAAARLLRSWVRIPPGEWIFVCCERCVLSGRGLCDELITFPEESYRLWCVVVCDIETSKMRRPWPALGRSTTGKKVASSNEKYFMTWRWPYR